MKILSHRGFWNDPSEKNTNVAFERALGAGLGIETDVRDYDQELIISHDPGRGEMTFLNFLNLVLKHRADSKEMTLALNIKSDGLSTRVRGAIQDAGIDNLFVFDMSGPETLRYFQAGLPFYSRQSEIEPNPILYEHCAGIWLDSFNSEWFDEALIKDHLAHGKRVAIVSPELHGRNHEKFWSKLLKMNFSGDPRVALCTDHPLKAQQFFR